MKKKLNSLIAVALCALATCFVLVGCSPVSGGKNAKMVGYWELVSGTSGGLEITEDDVKTMSEEGSQCILHLGDDGKRLRSISLVISKTRRGTWTRRPWTSMTKMAF